MPRRRRPHRSWWTPPVTSRGHSRHRGSPGRQAAGDRPVTVADSVVVGRGGRRRRSSWIRSSTDDGDRRTSGRRTGDRGHDRRGRRPAGRHRAGSTAVAPTVPRHLSPRHRSPRRLSPRHLSPHRPATRPRSSATRHHRAADHRGNRPHRGPAEQAPRPAVPVAEPVREVPARPARRRNPGRGLLDRRRGHPADGRPGRRRRGRDHRAAPGRGGGTRHHRRRQRPGFAQKGADRGRRPGHGPQSCGRCRTTAGRRCC